MLDQDCLLRTGARGRTLHQAEDAQDTKWIAQQWVACGAGVRAPSANGSGVAPAAPAFEELVAARAKRSPAEKLKKKGSEQGAAKQRGFGAR